MRLATAILCAAVVTLTTTAVFASGSTSSRKDDKQLTIVLKINVDRTPVEFSIAAAVEEANRLWRPYGIALVQTTGDLTEASLAVDIQELPLARSPRAMLMTPLMTPLGAIDFSADGSPSSRIRISLRSIVELVAPSQRPMWGRETVLSRALGRVLAHEIGHFVLRLPSHVPSGLMAANHTTDEFADREPNRFALTPLLEFRLRQLVDEACRRGVTRLPDARLPD